MIKYSGIVTPFDSSDPMISLSLTLPATTTKIRIWLIGVSFVLFQFFLQLSSGVVIGTIMEETGLTAFAAGMLGSAFYYVYTTLQIPVGMLFDRQSTRLLLSLSALACSAGCIFFAHSHHLLFLFIGRMLIGAGSAFAFVGLSHLLRQHFPLKHFAFIIGFSETLGFLVTVVGIISLGALIGQWGWRLFINWAAVVGVLISFLIWRYIPEKKPIDNKFAPPSLQLLLTVLKCSRLWISGLFVGLSFALITVFAAMWAVPFIQCKLHCTMQTASLVDAMIFLGAALGCPLFGFLVSHCKKRRPLMMLSCHITAILVMITLFAPIHNTWVLGGLMFAIGLCCGAYMLAYSIANELSPKGALSTSTGFVNTLAMLSAPLLQPVVGFLLDWHAAGQVIYHIIDFQWALTIIPLCLFMAGGLVVLLPEKKTLS